MINESLINLGEAVVEWTSNETSLEEALRSRIEHHDFRFFELLAAGLTPEQLTPLKANYSEELVVERKTLEEALKSTWDAIDQARKDGVIEFETDQWDEYSNILNDVIIEEILNFEPVHDALDEIKNRLAKCGDLRRDELIREWSDLEARVAHDIDFDAGFVDSWKTTFEKASRVGSLDIRVMEYCVSRFRDYVSGEEGLISPTFDDSAQDKLLETFLAFYGETRQKADGHLTKKRSVRTTTSRTK